MNRKNRIAQWAFDTGSLLGRFHLWLEDVAVECRDAACRYVHDLATVVANVFLVAGNQLLRAGDRALKLRARAGHDADGPVLLAHIAEGNPDGQVKLVRCTDIPAILNAPGSCDLIVRHVIPRVLQYIHFHKISGFFE